MVGPAYETIDVDEDGPVCTVSLNRPDVRNAFNRRAIVELSDVFTSLASREDIRVVILRGNGKSFSAGADAEWMAESLQYSRAENVTEAREMAGMFAVIDQLPQPIVARVHGAALGGGLGLMAVSDIVVVSEDALFGFTETRLGILPAVISTFVLPKIGESWARALFTTGERFDAEMAHRIGLVHWIAPAQDLDAVVADKVQALLAGGPLAVRSAKSLIREIRGLEQEDLFAMTASRIAEARAGVEGQEGLTAFLEKRRPSWSGS